MEASGIDILWLWISPVNEGTRHFSLNGRQANRLDVAKSVVAKFIEWPSDRIGLVAFAGKPILSARSTLYYDWLQQGWTRCASADRGTAPPLARLLSLA